MKDCNNYPMISIVMASCNPRIEMLKKALDSIYEQTYKNFELIFVDDGCSKECLSLVKEYESKFKIKILTNITNFGLPKSLNEGIKVAKGKYIARLDDDDEMLPERLEKQIDYIEKFNDYAGCWTEFIYVDNDDNEVSRSHINGLNYIKRFICKGNCCCHSSLFVKKSVLEEIGYYNEKFIYSQDLELYLRILEKYKMGCVDDYLVKFRINTTRNPIEKNILSFVFSFAAALEYMNKSKNHKVKFYIFLRFFVLFKFVFRDLDKLNEK